LMTFYCIMKKHKNIFMNDKKNNQSKLSAMLEAILFMYGGEISFAYLVKLLDIGEEEIAKEIKKLKKKYDERENSGLAVLVQSEKVQMVTRPEVARVIEKMTKKELEGPLTPVAMEVLSIIAYRGPIAKIDIEAIRGVNCSFSLRNLVRRGLIEQVQDKHKKTRQYQITIDFLRLLGISSVEELPKYEDLAKDERIDAVLYSDINE